MRATIRQLLVAGVPEIGERWYEPHAADAQTPKPFGVLRAGEQDAGDAWGGPSTPLEAWPYVDRASFVTVDALAKKIADTLDNRTLTEGTAHYLVRHEVTAGRDFYDEDWQAITRPVRFRVYTLGWLSGLTYAPDPVAALRTWTAAQFPQVQTDPLTWNPADATPAVYWRLAAVPSIERRNWGAWATATLRGHAIAPSEAVRLEWARRLAERLAVTLRVPLGGGWMLLGAVAVDTDADPMRAGQLALGVRYGVLRSAAADEVIEHATVTLLPIGP